MPSDRLVLVHGFAQNRNCWGRIADELAVDHDVVAVDTPGHGAASALDVGFEEGAELIGGAGGGPATYVGYSMGGRYCLQIALARPDLVERLVLIGASPGIEDEEGRRTRREADHALADRIETIGVGAFVDEWLALPLFDGLDGSTRFVEERRANTASGLASSLRRAGAGEQPDLWPRLGSIAMPVLLVTGEHDAKFTAIAARMAAAIGPTAANQLIVARAGHSAHLENPTAFLAALRGFV